MKYNTKKSFIAVILFIILILVGNITLAHSGRTDSSGGHKDNKNVSGLGSYHYHCGGHPAHLHPNGVCPYSSSSSPNQESSSESNTKTSQSSEVTKPIEPVTVTATAIEIDKDITSIKVGESKMLTATISPSNTTDKNVSWKSSDENIIEITSIGKVTAKKAGIAKIIASTSNGKENILEINVEEIEKENNITQNLATDNKVNNRTTSTSEDTNLAVGIIGLGLLGGGGYWAYKKLIK